MSRILNGRTSTSYPLIIDTLPFHNGALGLTFCPGKKQAYAMTGAWNRDIDLDLDVVEAWGATTVISLLEPFEYDELQVPELPGKFATRFRWLDLPIRDQHAPNEAWLARWVSLRDEIQQELIGGGRIMIHCKGGFGRTGTVAVMILMEGGINLEDAILLARKTREGAVETSRQEQFLADYARAIGKWAVRPPTSWTQLLSAWRSTAPLSAP